MTQNSADFWNKVARRYANMTIRNPEGYEATLERVRSYLRPNDQVLELGCGTGTTALKLGGLVKRYVACDYAGEMIAIANEKKSQEANGAPEFLIAQTCDGSLPRGPFDVVLAFNVLHLLSDRRTAFDEVADRLPSGGYFISKTPCLSGFFRVLKPIVVVLQWFGKAPNFNFLSAAQLELEIKNAGFRVVADGDKTRKSPRHVIVAQKA